MWPIGDQGDSEWGKKGKSYAGVVLYVKSLEKVNP
jgi:hypothetical protein